MGPKDRIFKQEYAQELFKIAENDLVSAKTLAKNISVRRETVLMMVQQSVEKSLKSVLCRVAKPIPQTHDLQVLIERLGPDSVPPFSEELGDLTPFATMRRYEEGRFEILDEDLDLAFEAANKVLLWAKNLL